MSSSFSFLQEGNYVQRFYISKYVMTCLQMMLKVRKDPYNKQVMKAQISLCMYSLIRSLLPASIIAG